MEEKGIGNAVFQGTVFRYDAQIAEKFPNTVGGIIVGRGVRNGDALPELKSLYREEQAKVYKRIGSKALSEIEALAAWRGMFRRFGVNPTKYRAAPEALLRRLTKSGDIPNINALVDMGNLVSIRYALPVAVVDLRAVEGTITVHIADGSERFQELGSDVPVHPEPGEVVFSDETAMVLARRWCWRQSAESAARPGTTDILVTIEAQHKGGRADVEAAVKDLLALLEEFAQGEFRYQILDAQNPEFSLN